MRQHISAELKKVALRLAIVKGYNHSGRSQGLVREASSIWLLFTGTQEMWYERGQWMVVLESLRGLSYRQVTFLMSFAVLNVLAVS